MSEPRLQLTVSRALWDEIAQDCGAPFADSYLSGATETVTTLTPWTVTAYLRLSRNGAAKAALTRRGLKLIEPLPFGSAGRPENRGIAA